MWPSALKTAAENQGDMQLDFSDPHLRFELILIGCSALLIGIVVFVVFL